MQPHPHTHLLGHPKRKVPDEIKGILRLKLYNANIHTYTSHFMEIQQKENKMLAAYIHYFKTATEKCTFDNDTVAIWIFVKGL